MGCILELEGTKGEDRRVSGTSGIERESLAGAVRWKDSVLAESSVKLDVERP